TARLIDRFGPDDCVHVFDNDWRPAWRGGRVGGYKGPRGPDPGGLAGPVGLRRGGPDAGGRAPAAAGGWGGGGGGRARSAVGGGGCDRGAHGVGRARRPVRDRDRGSGPAPAGPRSRRPGAVHAAWSVGAAGVRRGGGRVAIRRPGGSVRGLRDPAGRSLGRAT